MDIHISDLLFDRYLAGDCSAAESAAVEAWLASAPVPARAVTWLRSELDVAGAPDAAQAWGRFSTQLEADEAWDRSWWAYPAQWARSLIAAGAAAGLVGILAIGVASVWSHARSTGADIAQGSLMGVVTNDIPTRPLLDLAIRPSGDDWADAVLH